VAGVATALSVVAGVPLGATAGYLGGAVAEVVMRAMDGLLAFPALLLASAVVAALGPGHYAAIAIGVVGIPVFARLTGW
jgi:ABC-type dipeptide/oligopeptide/nickel transport system permease subunit